jgi:dTDP-glucose 4,6-dehydratase
MIFGPFARRGRADAMKLLVTGGCGFIGSHFIEYTLKNYPSDSVLNLDALTYAAHPDTVNYLGQLAPDRYRLVSGDIGSPIVNALLERENIEVVVNFAAESHVDRSILDPGAFVRTNILGLQLLLDAVRNHGEIRFVQVSTDEVYGSLEPEEETSTEVTPLDPNSPYAASKAAADLLALAIHRTYGQEVLITRCTNNYGPFQFPEKLLPLLIANALEDLPVPVYGDGLQVRDWIYVKDHCRAIDTVLRKGKAGEIYNISASEERRNLDVIREVLDKLGKPRSLIQFVGDRPAHDRRYGLDASKISRDLGWVPEYSFERGMQETLSWYLENREWWQKVRDKEYFKFYRENYHDKFQTGGKLA